MIQDGLIGTDPHTPESQKAREFHRSKEHEPRTILTHAWTFPCRRLLLSEGCRHLLSEGRHLLSEGRHLLSEGRHLLSEGRHLLSEGCRRLLSEGRHLLSEGRRPS